MWLHSTPTTKSAWCEQAFDVLLGEWGVAQDERLRMWLREHCGEEMITNVDGIVAGYVTPEKKKAIKVVLHSSCMPPKVFSPALGLAQAVR